MSKASAILLLYLSQQCFGFWVHTPSISVEVLNGQLAFVNTSDGWQSAIASLSWLGEQGVLPKTLAVNASECVVGQVTGVCVTRQLSVQGQTTDAKCCQTYVVDTLDTFLPVSAADNGLPHDAVAWQFSVTSSSPLPWRTSIVSDLDWLDLTANASDVLYWVPRGGNSTTDWDDVLRMLTADDPAPRRTAFGDGYIYEQDIAAGREIMPVPLSVIASASLDAGVAVVPAPNDTLFGVAADLNATHSRWLRVYNRLGQNLTVSFTVYLVPLGGADWRPAFDWSRAMFPAYYRPTVELAAAAGSGESDDTDPAPPLPALQVGLGLYSCADPADMNLTSVVKLSGATHIWDAHFWWPYIGMFLPPADEWASNYGDGEEYNCGASFSRGVNTSRSRIAAYYADAAASGLTALAYFNLIQFGQNVQLPPSSSSPAIARRDPPDDDWRNSSQFIVDRMLDAVLAGPEYDWQNSVVTDPGQASWQNVLVAQATDKVDSFGAAFNGIVVDRTDPTSRWNMDAADADSLGWCGQPCRSMLTGWLDAARRVSEVVHETSPTSPSERSSQRVAHGDPHPDRSPQHSKSRASVSAPPPPRLMLLNYAGSSRFDLLRDADGIFTEDYKSKAQLQNLIGLSTTSMPPAIIWTYTVQEVQQALPNPNTYMQQLLSMKVAPMAPVIGNDHSIQPDPQGWAQAFYADYGNLFRELAGARWWLAAHAVRTEQPDTSRGVVANAFVWGGDGVTSVVKLTLFAFDPSGAADGSVALSIADPPLGAAFTCRSISPGAAAWSAVAAPQRNPQTHRWTFAALPLQRGAVMVSCTN